MKKTTMPFNNLNNVATATQRDTVAAQRQENQDCSRPSDTLNRLFSVAFTDPDFCQLLLTDPIRAIDMGHNKEPFSLSDQERTILITANAKTLTDLARSVLDYYQIAIAQEAGNGRDYRKRTTARPEGNQDAFRVEAHMLPDWPHS
ncbi:MAG: hypothetical protein AAF629_00975 [Chloroflexota bacterium]